MSLFSLASKSTFFYKTKNTPDVSRAVLSTIRRQKNGSSGVTPKFIVSYRDVARLVNYTRIRTKESCDDYITIKCHMTYEVNELFITYCNILSFLKRETKANI